MIDEVIANYSGMIDEATNLLSLHFKKSIRFSKVIQLSEVDRRNIILRLLIDNPTTEMPNSIILKKTAIDNRTFDAVTNNETEIEQLSRFAHDWAGIEFLTT